MNILKKNTTITGFVCFLYCRELSGAVPAEFIQARALAI